MVGTSREEGAGGQAGLRWAWGTAGGMGEQAGSVGVTGGIKSSGGIHRGSWARQETWE